MKISYNWLKQFLNLKDTVEDTADMLTELGLEVEDILDFKSIKGGLKGVVIGKVRTCKKHPNADRLKIKLFVALLMLIQTKLSLLLQQEPRYTQMMIVGLYRKVKSEEKLVME